MNINLYDLAMADQAMKSGSNLRERVGYVGRAALVVASHPLEGLDRIRGRTEIVLCEHLSSVAGQKPSATTAEPVKNLHELLDVDWPCPLEEGFNAAWSDLGRHMASRGLKVGEGHDADANLAHVVWCAIRHMDPQRVLETGVARGVTSVLALGAMAQSNGGLGRLWSIDLPPMMSGWHEQSKVLVDETAWPDWTYIRGSSRRTMASTCASMESIDIFIHDSLHTPQTMKYEFEEAWPFMRAGGLLISDDVEGNSAFVDFVKSRRIEKWFTAPKADKEGMFGVALKP
jgi:predicted O-methyltransferase YrrM